MPAAQTLTRSLALLTLPVLVLSACGGPTAEPGQATTAASASTAGDASSADGQATTTAQATDSEGDSQGSGSPAPAASTPAGPSCLDLAKGLDRSQQIGQLFMVGTQAQEADATLQQVVRNNNIGSVIYLGSEPRSQRDTAVMSSRMSGWAAKGIGVLMAVDQEGGQVQRLAGTGFSDMPSAVTQSQMSDAELRTSWARWGKELRSAGVRYDLAPVADVVPEDMSKANEPIGALRRGYGSTDAQVGAKATAVVQGLADAGVASSLKHYPGLGRVTTNTDFGSATDTVTTLADAKSFRTAMAAGASSVMISSTIYDKIDPGVHAVFSSKIITDGLRGQDGWDKVVISDDLGAAAAVANTPAKDRGVRFIAAGGDLVINADPGLMADMVAGVEQKAQGDQAFADELPKHVARVLALKAEVGLVECSR